MCNLPALFCLSEIESGSQADDTVMATLPSGTIRVAAIFPSLSLSLSPPPPSYYYFMLWAKN